MSSEPVVRTLHLSPRERERGFKAFKAFKASSLQTFKPYLRSAALASRVARKLSSGLQFGQSRELASFSPKV